MIHDYSAAGTHLHLHLPPRRIRFHLQFSFQVPPVFSVCKTAVGDFVSGLSPPELLAPPAPQFLQANSSAVHGQSS